MIKFLRSHKGFTLVELMLYMGLMSILLVVLTNVFLSVLDVQSESAASSSVEQDGRFLIAKFAYDVYRASAIVSPAVLGVVSNNTAALTIGGVTNTYDGSSGNLLVTDNVGTDQLNSFGSRISNLQFTRIGNPGGKNDLQIKFTLTSTTTRPKGAETRNFQITVGQR